MNNRLKRLSGHDLDSREFAILYINDEFIESTSHSYALKKYLDRNNIEYMNNMYYRKDVEQQLDETEVINDYAFLHYVDATNTCLDENTGIYIDTDSLNGISLNDLISKVKGQYPNLAIYDDNKVLYEDVYEIRYEQLAKKKAGLEVREYILPSTPDYPQDYFKQRDPERLKRLKNLHDNSQ